MSQFHATWDFKQGFSLRDAFMWEKRQKDTKLSTRNNDLNTIVPQFLSLLSKASIFIQCTLKKIVKRLQAFKTSLTIMAIIWAQLRPQLSRNQVLCWMKLWLLYGVQKQFIFYICSLLNTFTFASLLLTYSFRKKQSFILKEN